MTTKTIQTGDRTITITDDAEEGGAHDATGTMVGMPDGPFHRDDDAFDGGSFVAGMFVAALIAMCLSVWRSSRAGKSASRRAAPAEPDRMASDVAALARRTAALETIVTDPAHRTAREIDALR